MDGVAPVAEVAERDPARGLQGRDEPAQQPVVAGHALDEQPDRRGVGQAEVQRAHARQVGEEQDRLLVQAQVARIRRVHEPEVSPVGVEQRLGLHVEDVEALVAVRLVADEPEVAAVRRERGARLVAQARDQRRQHPAAADARIAARHDAEDAERYVAPSHAATAFDGVDVEDDRPSFRPDHRVRDVNRSGPDDERMVRGKIVRGVLDEHLPQRPAPRERTLRR